MHALLDGIPLDTMNTSMTINATAAWLLALYIVTAEDNGIDPGALQGTTQNDIIKEFLARGTYAFPPGPSMRLIADMVAYTVEQVPKWNPINICSYHLQEAGATPVQEIAYAMANAIAVLDAVCERVPRTDGPGLRAHLVLRQRRRALRRGARQAARDGRALGGARPRALRREDPKHAALPLRRAGQLARPHRVPAGEQRPAHRARGARGHARPRRPRPRHPAARVERGARACRGRGTSSGRCASSRCSPTRPTCSSTPTSSRAPRSWTASSTSCWRARAPSWRSSPSTAARSRPCRYMKAALVDSHRERIRRIECGRADRRRRQQVTPRPSPRR